MGDLLFGKCSSWLLSPLQILHHPSRPPLFPFSSISSLSPSPLTLPFSVFFFRSLSPDPPPSLQASTFLFHLSFLSIPLSSYSTLFSLSLSHLSTLHALFLSPIHYLPLFSFFFPFLSPLSNLMLSFQLCMLSLLSTFSFSHSPSLSTSLSLFFFLSPRVCVCVCVSGLLCGVACANGNSSTGGHALALALAVSPLHADWLLVRHEGGA